MKNHFPICYLRFAHFFSSSGLYQKTASEKKNKLLPLLLLVLFCCINAYGQVKDYTFSSSAGTYSSITGTAAHAAPWNDGVVTVPLGFTFSYNGIDYTTCSVNTNGFITFGTTPSAVTLYTPISGTTAYEGAISALGFDLISNGSAIIYTTTGTAPNRTFIVQWTNANRRSGSTIAGDFNFQIRLSETSNIINIVYGSCSTSVTTGYNVQVGLRGAANSDFNNRSLAAGSSWDTGTVAGTLNNAVCATNNATRPTSGRTFTWSPGYKATFISADVGLSAWCAGETRNISVTIKNTGSAPWIDGGGNDFNVGVKWNTSGTSWTDYHVRKDAKNLAPGSTETYNFTITASANVNGVYGPVLPAGANNLTFDVVYEGRFWFGNAPGNSVFVSPAQTVFSPLTTAVASPVPANNATGICYQGFGAVTAVSWGTLAGAASYDVYFGAGSLPNTVTSNVSTASYNTGALAANTTYFWKVVPRNTCGITTAPPVTWTFTTPPAPCTATAYCTPSVTTPTDLYINSFQFVGTLNDNAGPNTSGASGYSNFTALTPVMRQPQGAVLNILASALGSTGQPGPGYWKAWVDFNGNGVFEAGEQVYSLTSFSTESLTFGFVIPAATPPGKYRFRIRVGSDSTFDACSTVAKGETEDYLFEVVADCAAKINTTSLKDVQRCGTGTVTLTATGTGSGIRWYANATGGTPLFEGNNFLTPVISENTRTTYYVVAYNGTCESVFRIPVTAIANQGPVVNFSTVPSFCSTSTSGQLVGVNNGVRLDVLLNEPFDTNLGAFQQQKPIEPGYLDIANAYWINRPSPYIPPSPPYEGLAPALSSGYTGGNFAMNNTDINRQGELLNRLTLTNNLDTRNFNNLQLDFDLYYFTLVTAANPENYFSVDYSVDGGVNWINLPNLLNLPNPDPLKPNIYTSVGNPNIWKKISISLPPGVLNKTAFKIRFTSYSFGKSGSTSFKESIAAIDNVKIYGIKDENSLFSWTSPSGGILYESNCTTPLNATKTSTVCVKPTALQFENSAFFSITASATFDTGCPATGTTIIANDLKVYDTTASTDWNTATNWKPENLVPNALKCVIIKKPVIINSSTAGLAKNITVEPGGTLNINGSLKITDWLRNNSTVSAVVVESDGGLVQENEGNTINTGSITARRIVNLSPNRQQYNYIISPLEGQVLKNIYPGIDYVLYHNEANNYFYNSTGAYIKGRGLAVKEPNKTGVPGSPASVTANFTGYPTNGAFTYGIVKSSGGNLGSRGYNLVGNPYPSNMDLIEFYKLNGGAAGNISSTFSLWDNRANSQTLQMGDRYGQQAYAQFNAVTPPLGGTGILATGDAGLSGTNRPTQYIKMGQAFLVQSNLASQQLKFNNTIRTTTKGTVSFFGKGSAATENSADRFWLNMITPDHLAAQIAVVYFEGGNNGLGDDDSYSLGGSDALYSIVESEKVSINGRSSFAESDVVPLGTAHFEEGQYTFAIQDMEGIFANGQSIYLKDKQMGIITNLSEGSYTFSANAGESNSRFEIVYLPETVLATDSNTKESLFVYRDGNDFVVKSHSQKITALEVYDAAGRLMMTMAPNQDEVRLHGTSLINGVYVLKINRNGAITTKKVIR